MILSFQERKDRIFNTSHIVVIEDSTVHLVYAVEQVGSIVYVDVGGVLFQDTEIMTLKEAAGAERFLNKVKELLIIK